MARNKQKARGFNKFLDFIGLVDADQEDEFDPEFDQPRSSARGRGNRNAPIDDEFAEEPRMTRASTAKRERSASEGQYGRSHSRYEAENEWQGGSSRPDYGTRTQSRAGASARYGSEQRYGATSQNRSSRYSASSQDQETGYRGGYSTQRQSAANYASSYGASARWNDAEASFGTSQEVRASQNGGYQRHQTIIIHLQSVEGCKEVILSLIEKKTVLLNLDELDSLQTQRALDTMSGATYAIGARLSRASDRTWLITPSNVEVASSQGEETGYSGGRYM